jgi:hypothetical protein
MTNCCICIDTFEKGDNMVTTPCGHVMHNKCLTQWLLTNNNCPMCRFTFGEDTEFEHVNHIYNVNFTNDIISQYSSTIAESLEEIEEIIKQINETKSYQNIYTRFNWVTNNNNLFYLKLYKRQQIIDIEIVLENISENFSNIYITFKCIDKQTNYYLEKIKNNKKYLYTSNYSDSSYTNPRLLYC